MESNVTMILELDSFIIEQRTNDGFFNATGLLNQWNKENGEDKRINDYLKSDETKMFIEEVIKNDNVKGDLTRILKVKDNPVNVIRGRNGGTWMHPLVFIDFAKWINPMLRSYPS